MDDRTYLKQGLRKSPIPLPIESKLKDYDGMKLSAPTSDNLDEGFEVIVMRNRNKSSSTSKADPTRGNDKVTKTRSRGRSPARTTIVQQWPSFVETESNDSTSSNTSSNGISFQKKELDKHAVSKPKSSHTKPVALIPKSPAGTIGSYVSSDSKGRSSSNPQKGIQESSSPSHLPVDDIEILIQSALQGTRFSPRAPSPRRGRSLSQSRHSRHSSRTRSNSRCRSMGIEEYTFAAKIEPNVHDNAIMNKEVKTRDSIEMNENELFARKAGLSFSSQLGDYLISTDSIEGVIQDGDDYGNFTLSPKFKADQYLYDENNAVPPNATFFQKSRDMSTMNMIVTQQDLLNIQNIAGKISVDWTGSKLVAPSVARRFVDFQFARMKRKETLGTSSPWGVLGLYEYLASVRTDVDWAEQAAKRRANGEPYTAWSGFIDKKNQGKNRPWLTYVLMVVCSVMLLVSIGINGWALESLSINPMIGPSVLTLIKLGAKDSILIVQKYELWRLIAPMVLHAGLVHYFLNMSALWFVGAALEKAHGHWSLLLVFAVSGIGGTIASSIFLPKFISVGASGGIFGLIGACLADICLNWSILFNQALAGKSIIRHGLIVLVLFFDILLNAVIGLTPLLDNFQHLTGMVLGFLCGISTIKRVSTNFLGEFQQWGFFQRTKQLFRIYFGLVLSLFAIIGGIVLLMNGDGVTSPCPGCSVISCVEFPPWVSYNNRWWHCDDCSTVTAVVSMTSLQMNMTCPSGQNVTFPLHDDYMNVDFLKKNLVSVCRNVCLKKH